jgi:hypothetical protein
VLWIEAVIVGLERHIAGKDVVALIPTQRFAPNGEDNLSRHYQQQRKNCRSCPYSSFQPESPIFSTLVLGNYIAPEANCEAERTFVSKKPAFYGRGA